MYTFPARFNAEYHEPGRNEPCICGSGLKFKNCCSGSYCSEAWDKFQTAYNRGDYEVALVEGRRHFTWYVLSHKAHTLPLLEANRDAGHELLHIDIEALAELLQNLHLCYFKLQRSSEFPQVIDRVRGLISDSRWTDKIAYAEGLWHLIDQNDVKAAFGSLSAIEFEACKDPDVLSLYLEVCPKNLSLPETLKIIDRILSNTPKEDMRLQYRVFKAVQFYLVCQQEEANRLFEEAIAKFSAFPKEKQSVYGRVLLARALAIYGKAGDRKDPLEKAKQVTCDLIREAEGQGYTSAHIADLYQLLGDCEEDLGNHTAAIDSYAKCLAADPRDLAKVFLARSLCNSGHHNEARDRLSEINEPELDDPGKFDLAISWALLAATSLRPQDIEDAKARLRSVNNRYPVFIQLRDHWMIDLLEMTPASETGTMRRLIRRLNSYVTLNPNLFGFGLNINKIIDDVDSATTKTDKGIQATAHRTTPDLNR